MKKLIKILVAIIMLQGVILAEEIQSDAQVLAGRAKTNTSDSLAKGRSVEDFIDSDGRFDLDAIRTSGYKGSLNLDEFDVLLDPIRNEPIVRPSVAKPQRDDPDDIYWDNSISPSFPGTSDDVDALTVYNGQLIAAGHFAVAEDISANRIAAWDGSTWSPLGQGMNNTVYALTVYDDQLIAGGYYTTAGGVVANKIAAWDGSSWSPLGQGMNNTVYALTVYDGQLIAGGYYTTAGGSEANCIAAWDGSSWSALDLGVGPEYMYPCVRALTVYDNKLIVGGSFWMAGDTTANNIAAWNGSSWSPLGSGVHGVYNHDVWALTVFNNQLIAGGEFKTAGGGGANRIAAWNGSSWSPLGQGMNGTVKAIAVYDNQLIAGGNFKTAGSVVANYIAAWNGSI